MIRTRETELTERQIALQLVEKNKEWERLHPVKLISQDKAMKCKFYSHDKTPDREILHPKPIMKYSAQLRFDWWDDCENQNQN